MAEITLDVPTPIGPHVHRVEARTEALPPLGNGDHAMVLMLVANSGDSRRIHDFANYGNPQHFPTPHFDGAVGYAIDGGHAILRASSVTNPRSEGNTSGTLGLELWALPEPYAGGAPGGQRLAAAELGSISGQYHLPDIELRSAFAQPAPGRWHVALLLREWTLASGYVTRDYRNFDVMYEQAAPQEREVSASAASAATDKLRLIKPAIDAASDSVVVAPAAAIAAAAPAAPTPTASAAVKAPAAAPVPVAAAVSAPAAPVSASVAVKASAPTAAVVSAPVPAPPVAAASVAAVKASAPAATPVVAAPTPAAPAASAQAPAPAATPAATAPAAAVKASAPATTPAAAAPVVAVKAPAAAVSAPARSGVLNVQTASLEELSKLPGLSLDVAKEIVKARPFASLEALAAVRGIGNKTLKRIKSLISL